MNKFYLKIIILFAPITIHMLCFGMIEKQLNLTNIISEIQEKEINTYLSSQEKKVLQNVCKKFIVNKIPFMPDFIEKLHDQIYHSKKSLTKTDKEFIFCAALLYDNESVHWILRITNNRIIKKIEVPQFSFFCANSHSLYITPALVGMNNKNIDINLLINENTRLSSMEQNHLRNVIQNNYSFFPLIIQTYFDDINLLNTSLEKKLITTKEIIFLINMCIKTSSINCLNILAQTHSGKKYFKNYQETQKQNLLKTIFKKNKKVFYLI